MEKTVSFAGHRIGDGHPVFLVAELGVTHEQNVELARSFTRAAASAGFDSVKVESFQADDLVVDKTMVHTYGTADGVVRENYYDLLKRLELSYADFAAIKREADAAGTLFFPTVATASSVDFFESIGVAGYKLASPDLVNFPLQKLVAATGKVLFMDTGGGFLHEIEKAVLHLEARGASQVVLMHNPSGYPAPPEKTDLRMIRTLKDVFDIPVGLSCHTPGTDCVMAAVALGANVIEKPVTRDTTIAGPEHVFSLPIGEGADFVARIRRLETSLGGRRRLSVDENSLPRRIGRRGVYAARDLKAGHVLEFADILLAKPQQGVPVELLDQVLGRALGRDLARHTPVTWEVF
ncbi:N-acetylneuraminate synthase family protein [Desulfolutivibrio sulfoxidireducens]|uniref:N-acetylneuraminate synthase family protein n=1 Tax=Desulfolutivibrio sulfoxidireducens TaxID=2773299 RepID=UPI00159DD75E|nr:N-acetylneuraminate synthase family protein [Desulfolutivibrio sulfoxidireducens]QLA20623.1 hypothetical protein GD604_13335 [Desulfolutivibrio sulfoxidireducens]